MFIRGREALCAIVIEFEYRAVYLRLDVDFGSVLHEQLDDLELSGERGDVQRRVALLRGRVDVGAAFEQLVDDAHVALLRRQMQRRQPVLPCVHNHNRIAIHIQDTRQLTTLLLLLLVI